MGELRPGMTVPMRKPKLNPYTVSGHPMWNKYASLDYVGCTKELRMKLDGCGALVNRPQMPGSNSVRICKVMNRATMHRDQFINAFDQVRALSLRMDRSAGISDWQMYNRLVEILKRDNRKVLFNKLVHLERCRGVVRAAKV